MCSSVAQRPPLLGRVTVADLSYRNVTRRKQRAFTFLCSASDPNELTVSRPTDETSLAELVRPLDLVEAEPTETKFNADAYGDLVVL
jgi:hypothetical protein